MKKLIFICVICMLVLCGCSSSTEPDDFAYVIAIGIDKGEDGTPYITFVTAQPSNISTASNSKEGSPVKTNTFQANNIFVASDYMSANINRKIDFSHCRLIAFSKELAADGFGVFRKTLLNEKSFRPDTLIAITETNTAEFFESSKNSYETNPAKFFEQIFNSNHSPYSVACTLKNFTGGRQNILPLADETGVKGTGIIKNDKLVAQLNETQTSIYKLLTGENRKFYMDFPKEGVTLALNREKEPEIALKCGERIEISVTLYLNGEIIAEDKNLSHTPFANNIKSQCLNFLNYTAKEIDCDVLNTGKMARAKFLTLKDYEKYDFANKYKDAEFNVKVIYSDLKTGERNF